MPLFAKSLEKLCLSTTEEPTTPPVAGASPTLKHPSICAALTGFDLRVVDGNMLPTVL
jgi:hypothetical protein